MRKRLNIKFAIYPLVLLVMIFATFEYTNIYVCASGTCCEYGNQCPEGKGREPTLKCCRPASNEAPCSQSLPNYCRENCL